MPRYSKMVSHPSSSGSVWMVGKPEVMLQLVLLDNLRIARHPSSVTGERHGPSNLFFSLVDFGS